MTWMTIDTAPKDGTVIDLWIECVDCEFRGTDFRWSAQEGDWVGDGSDYVVSKHFGNVGPVPTYWMPLPSPPIK